MNRNNFNSIRQWMDATKPESSFLGYVDTYFNEPLDVVNFLIENGWALQPGYYFSKGSHEKLGMLSALEIYWKENIRGQQKLIA